MSIRARRKDCVTQSWRTRLLAAALLAPLSASAPVAAYDSKPDNQPLRRLETDLAEMAPLTAKVDERVELISIAYRLAGAAEFVAAPSSAYSQAVDQHFMRFSDHPLIQYIKRFNDQQKSKGSEPNGWEVLSLAAHISDPPALAPLVPFGADKNVDAWDSRTLLDPELLALLRQFHRDAVT